MQTSDPDIFACGDCAEKVSFYDGQPSTLKLASIATMEARIAGANPWPAAGHRRSASIPQCSATPPLCCRIDGGGGKGEGVPGHRRLC